MSPDTLARNAPPVVIGVDPGTTTGVAVVRRGRLAELASLTPGEAASMLAGRNPCVVAVEDSREIGMYARRRGGRSVPEAFAMGRSVGRVDQITDRIAKAASEAGHRVVLVRADRLGSKWDAATMERRARWDGPSNQHTRDAARVALYACSRPATDSIR